MIRQNPCRLKEFGNRPIDENKRQGSRTVQFSFHLQNFFRTKKPDDTLNQSFQALSVNLFFTAQIEEYLGLSASGH